MNSRRSGSVSERKTSRNYIGLRQGTLPVPDAVLSQFPSRRAYQTFVESYDDQRTEIIEHLLFDEKD